MHRLLIIALLMSVVAAGCAAEATPSPALSTAGLETAVDFNKGTFDQQLGQGWYPFEGQSGNGYRWMGQTAELYLAAPPAGSNVHLRLQGNVPDIKWFPGATLDLSVSVDGKEVAQKKIEQSGTVQLDVPVTLDASIARHTVRLELSASAVPATVVPGSKDPRRLGIAVKRVLFVAGS